MTDITALIADLEAKREKTTQSEIIAVYDHDADADIQIIAIHNKLPECKIARFIRAEDAAAYVALHNAIPLLIEAYRAKVDECARLEVEVARLGAIIKCEKEEGVCMEFHRHDCNDPAPCDADNCMYMKAALHPEAEKGEKG